MCVSQDIQQTKRARLITTLILFYLFNIGTANDIFSVWIFALFVGTTVFMNLCVNFSFNLNDLRLN